MGTRMNRETYAQMVAEDKAWLLANAPHSCERDHVLAVLDASTDLHYPRERKPQKHEGPCWRNSHADCGC